MDETFDTIELPSGVVQPRMILGVPSEAAMLVCTLGVCAWFSFKTPLALLPLLSIWGWLKYQAYRDPQFLALWAGALSCKPYYSA